MRTCTSSLKQAYMYARTQLIEAFDLISLQQALESHTGLQESVLGLG